MRKTEVEREKEGGKRLEEKARGTERNRPEKKRHVLRLGLSGELSRAEQLQGSELGVGAKPGVEERRRERGREREERGLAAWVVQMGGTRHK